MKRLGLLRHAKSSWDDPAIGDFDRPLNARGQMAAIRMGQEFRSLELAYDLALVSPARRAADTFALVGGEWAGELETRSEPRLYGASLYDLLEIIRHVQPEVQGLLLVGHNPALHQLALHLAAVSGPLREKLPTGSLVEISLPAGRWREAGEAKGELVRFLRPRDLD